MRVWSFHPRYLDTKGLGGVWVETLLAKAVLEGKTKGYTRHPQLNRFRDSSNPVKYVSLYLRTVHDEATKRGFKYDGSKVGEVVDLPPLAVNKEQLEYEWNFFLTKLKKRSPEMLAEFSKISFPDTHPIFKVVEGGIASWEVVQAPEIDKGKKRKKEPKKAENDGEKSRDGIKEETSEIKVTKKRKLDTSTKKASEMADGEQVTGRGTRNLLKSESAVTANDGLKNTARKTAKGREVKVAIKVEVPSTKGTRVKDRAAPSAKSRNSQ